MLGCTVTAGVSGLREECELMTQAFIVAAVICALAVLGGYYAWSQNKGVSFILGIVALVAAFFAFIFGMFAAIGLFIKLIPIALLIITGWFLYSMMVKD